MILLESQNQSVLAHLDRFEAQLADFLAYNASYSRAAFDCLYEEMQGYKRNFLAEAQRPLLQDLMMLYDSIVNLGRNYQQTAAVDPATLVQNLEALAAEAEEILGRAGIERMSVTPEKLDVNLQRAVKTEIDQVLCAGGSTRMAMVRDMLQRKVPGRVNTQIEPDLCVAQGAARMAKLLAEATAPPPVGLSPHAYGVQARGEGGKLLVYPVILKDQQLPCTSAKPEEKSRPDYEYGLFYIAGDNQTRVVLEVFEFDVFEHKDVQEPESCRKIGSVVIENLPPDRPRGQPVFSTFALDESLQLTVSALDVSSGATKSAVLTLGDTSQEGIQKDAARSRAMSKLIQDTEVKS